MATRKDEYYVRKKRLPKWNNKRRDYLIFKNHHRKISKLKCNKTTEQLSTKWINQRKLTIPSSLVRKATGGSDNFLDYYDVENPETFGHEFENIILKILKLE